MEPPVGLIPESVTWQWQRGSLKLGLWAPLVSVQHLPQGQVAQLRSLGIRICVGIEDSIFPYLESGSSHSGRTWVKLKEVVSLPQGCPDSPLSKSNDSPAFPS